MGNIQNECMKHVDVRVLHVGWKVCEHLKDDMGLGDRTVLASLIQLLSLFSYIPLSIIVYEFCREPLA